MQLNHPRMWKPEYTPQNSQQRVVEEMGMDSEADQKVEEEEKDVTWTESPESDKEGEAAEVDARAYQLQILHFKTSNHS